MKEVFKVWLLFIVVSLGLTSLVWLSERHREWKYCESEGRE
jgi:hypothetical protein